MESRDETSLLLIGGRSGVGKSRTGDEIHHLLFERQVEHVYIEGDNLDMAFPTPWRQGYALAEQNLRAMWDNYQALGYRRLIYTNSAAVTESASDALAQAITGPVAVTGVLLQASDETTRERLGRREIGTALELHVERSLAASRALEEAAPAWVHRVPTDGLSVHEVALQVIDIVGWKTAR